MRIAVYTDQAFRRDPAGVSSARSFVVFLAHLAGALDRLVLLGRLDPEPGRSHQPVADPVEFVPLPWYPSGSSPLGVARAAAWSLRTFWRALDGVDAVWLLGPHGLCLPFALLAALRRRRVILGVRQDLPAYARSRHPDRRGVQVAALALDGAYRLLARACPTVVVGPGLARGYRRARRLLEIRFSLVSEDEIVAADDALARAYDGELHVLSVGRLDAEKNPLLLADVLARLHADDPRWRLVVCGDGPLAGALAGRLRELGVAEAATLAGHVPIDDGLLERYRRCHFFLHVSLTEGLPQVLTEAFASGLPVVATAVGGVEAAAGGAAELIPPEDPAAAVRALRGLAADAGARAALVRAGLERARATTIEAECRRVASFLGGG